MRKRFFAALLSFVMIFSLLPTSVLAADSGVIESALLSYETWLQGDVDAKPYTGKVLSSGKVQVGVGETVQDKGGMTFGPIHLGSIGVVTDFNGPGGAPIVYNYGSDIVDVTVAVDNKDTLIVTFVGKKDGVATVKIDFGAVFKYVRGAADGQTYVAGLLTYNVTVGNGGSGGTTDPKAPRKPNASEVENFGHGSPKSAVKLTCDNNQKHSCRFTLIRDDVIYDTGYSFGSVIKNDDRYEDVPSSQYPWMCEMTVYASPFLSEYNNNRQWGGKYGTHYLAKNKPDTAKIMWFYGTDGSWYYDNTNVPVEFYITCSKPSQNEFTLIYNENAPTGKTADDVTDMPNPKEVKASDTSTSHTFTISSNVPKCEGYVFQGWSTTPDGTAAYQPKGEITISKDTNLYAVWHQHTDGNGDGKCDEDGECMHPKDNGYCMDPDCDHTGDCCAKKAGTPNLADAKVTVDCKTDNGHDHTFKLSEIPTNCYQATPLGNQHDGKYHYTVTLDRGKTIEYFNGTQYANGRTHTSIYTQLAGTPIINWSWTWTGTAWELAVQETPAEQTVEVKCEATPSKPKDSDLNGTSYVEVVCDKNEHKTGTFTLSYGDYTVGNVEGDSQSGYTCTVTVKTEKYVNAYNKTINAGNVKHVKVSEEVQLTFSYDAGTKTWKSDTKATIHTTHEKQDPKPDEGKIGDAIGDAQVMIQCADKPIDHPTVEMRVGGLQNAQPNTSYRIDGNIATVTINNPEAYAAEYKEGGADHTYKADGSRTTFTLKWSEDKEKGWGWYFEGDYALINTTCATVTNQYTVSFDRNGGTGTMNPETVIAGSKYTLPACGFTAPSNKKFDGWEVNGTKYAVGASIEVNSSVIVKALWTDKGGSGSGGSHNDSYTLRYDTNGGEKLSSESKTSKWTKDYEDLPIPTREGYRFDGWYYDSKLKNEVTGDVKVNTSVVTLYAGWTAVEVPSMLNGDDHFAYVQGYKDGNVRPYGLISRAETTTIFFRLLKDSVRDGNLLTSNTYTDVTGDYWANTAISTMTGLGIVQGRSADTFDPNAPITRAQFAAICARFDTGKVYGTQSFSDIQGHWAQAYIERAAELGWIKGFEDGTFRPDTYITRAQAMTMINRVLNRTPDDEDDLLDNMNVWPDCTPNDWFYLAVQEATNSHDFKYQGGEVWTKLTKAPDWSRYEH